MFVDLNSCISTVLQRQVVAVPDGYPKGWNFVEVSLEQIMFLFPPLPLCVGSNAITGMLLPNRRKPGYANNLWRGEGRKREIWTGGAGQCGKYFQWFYNNQSISVSGFQVGLSCLEKISWALWVVALEQLSRHPLSLCYPTVLLQDEKMGSHQCTHPMDTSPLGCHQPSAGAIKTFLLIYSSPNPCGYLHILPSILIK